MRVHKALIFHPAADERLSAFAAGKGEQKRQNYIELLQKYIKKDLCVFILSRRQGGPGIGSARAVLPRPRPDATRCAAPQLCADNKALMETGPGSPSCGAAAASIAVLTEGGTTGDRTPRCAAAAAPCSGVPIHLYPGQGKNEFYEIVDGLAYTLVPLPLFVQRSSAYWLL